MAKLVSSHMKKVGSRLPRTRHLFKIKHQLHIGRQYFVCYYKMPDLFVITKCQFSPSARRHQNGQRLQILENKNGQGPITGNQYWRVI